jgi:hypothetical protein
MPPLYRDRDLLGHLATPDRQIISFAGQKTEKLTTSAPVQSRGRLPARIGHPGQDHVARSHPRQPPRLGRSISEIDPGNTALSPA